MDEDWDDDDVINDMDKGCDDDDDTDGGYDDFDDNEKR